MIRRIATAALAAAALLAAGPASAANKDIERLAVQIATLQGQVAEVQRASEESRAELRRLTELIAEQNALLKKSVADRRQQDEAVAASLKDLGDRVAEVAEALQAIKAQATPLLTPLPAADAAAGAPTPPARAPGGAQAPGRRAPPRRARPGPPRALQPGLRRLRARQLRPRHAGLFRVHPELPRHRLHRQCAVLDRRVPVREEDVRRGHRGLEHPLQGLPGERQAAGRPREEGHGAGEARPQEPGARRVPLRGGPLPQLAGGAHRPRAAHP